MLTLNRLVTMALIAAAAFLAFAQPAEAANQDSWSAAASMATGRSRHTATLLANGMVLVAGGTDDVSATGLSSAERYDPVTNTWSSAGNLTTARSNHTATLLANGKVLVVGGGATTDNFASCELYDPITNTWSPAASLATARSFHAATLLSDGRVLVTGGANENILDSVELYDPATDSWSNAARMSQDRASHTATLLRNGEVMVAGGFNLCTPGISCALQSTERYNPASNTWTRAANLPVERGWHTANLLANGKVMLAGGFINATIPPDISYLLYDPAADSWATGFMPAARYLHNAVALPFGKILVVGGIGAPPTFEVGCNVYEPITDSWSAAASIGNVRTFHATTSLSDGRVLVTGGYPSLATAELYSIVVSIPESPKNVSAGAYDGAAIVSWLPPNFDGGSPLSGYTVTASPGSATATAGPGERSVLVTGLTNGTTYTFTVTAQNIVGPSLPSGRSNAVTPFTIPDPPTGVAATARNASATVSWVPPVFNGGSRIIGYVVVSPDNVAVSYTDGTATSAIVSGLTNGTPYTFTVRATNAAGNSNPSSTSNTVTPQPLAIVSESPTGAAAAITSVVTAMFNRAIDPTTLKMTVNPGRPGGPAVDGSITCNSPCTVAAFTPKRPLKYATSYGVTVSGSSTGESASTSWMFTTVSR